MEKFWPFVQRHWALSFAFVAVLIIIILYERMAQGRSQGGVSPYEAVKLMNHEKAKVLDFRDRTLFDQGHIVNSVQAEVSSLDQHIKKWHKQKQRPIIVLADARTLLLVKKQLSQAGFQRIVTIQGGLKAWQDAKLPLEKA